MKEYPERPKEPIMLKICECGHTHFDHKGWDFNNTKKECTKCMCPKYIFEKTITDDEFNKREAKEFLDNLDDKTSMTL